MDVETAYIGDFFDPRFDWENAKGDASESLPRRLSEHFPNGHGAFHSIQSKVFSNELEGKCVSWGAVVAKVDKAQLVKLNDELFQGYRDSDNASYIAEVDEFKKYVAELEDGRFYALVACE